MKALGIILALLLALGCLTGCGSARPGKNAAPDTENAHASAPELSSYTVFCCSAKSGAGIEGVVLNFCTDTACTPITTSAQGEAVFTGPPASYHVQIVQIPAGWKLAQEEADWYTEPSGGRCRVPFEEVEE